MMVSLTEALIFARGWHGGTVYQIAKELNATTSEIIIKNLNEERVRELFRLAQRKRQDDFERYYKDRIRNNLKELFEDKILNF